MYVVVVVAAHLRITKYLGNRWIVNVLVLFRLVLHFEQVGISSPSSTSSLINKSKQLSNLHLLDDGSGTLKMEWEEIAIISNHNNSHAPKRKLPQIPKRIECHARIPTLRTLQCTFQLANE